MAKRVDISKGGLVQTGQHTAVLPLTWLTMLTKELSPVTDSTVTLRTKQDEGLTPTRPRTLHFH